MGHAQQWMHEKCIFRNVCYKNQNLPLDPLYMTIWILNTRGYKTQIIPGEVNKSPTPTTTRKYLRMGLEQYANNIAVK